MSNSAAWLDLSDAAREAVPPASASAEISPKLSKRFSWWWVFLLVALVWAISKFPAEISLWNQAAARQATLAGDYPAAVESLDRALQWQPDDPKLLVERCHLKLQAGDFAGAIDDATLALEASHDLPKNTRIWPLTLRAYTRGVANREIESASADIAEVFELAGEEARRDPSTLHTRGLVEFRQGKLDAAWEHLNLAIRAGEDRLGLSINELKRKMHMEVDRRTSEMAIKDLHQSLAAIYYHQIWAGQALAKRSDDPNYQKQMDLGLEHSRQQIRKLKFDPAKEIW